MTADGGFSCAIDAAATSWLYEWAKTRTIAPPATRTMAVRMSSSWVLRSPTTAASTIKP